MSCIAWHAAAARTWQNLRLVLSRYPAAWGNGFLYDADRSHPDSECAGSYTLANMKAKLVSLTAFVLVGSVLAAPAIVPTKTIVISPSATSTEPSYPTPTYAFHETIYGTQAKALVGMLMPILTILAIIPITLAYIKRRRERASISPQKPQSYQKGYWGSRDYAEFKCELDAGQEKVEMAGAGETPEMGNEEMRCELGEREHVEMAVEEPRMELGDGVGEVVRQVEKRKTWRESAMAKMGWRWSRQGDT